MTMVVIWTKSPILYMEKLKLKEEDTLRLLTQQDWRGVITLYDLSVCTPKIRTMEP